jgi:hypothetical protein
MLTWVRSLHSLNNFETLKDYIVSRQKQETLLRRRLTQASDFFREREVEKKIKKFSEDPKNIFKKSEDFSPEFPSKSIITKYKTLNYFIIFLCIHSLD